MAGVVFKHLRARVEDGTSNEVDVRDVASWGVPLSKMVKGVRVASGLERAPG